MLAVVATLAAVAVAVAQGRNEITGRVYGESNRPVSYVYVELLNDIETTVARVKTDGSGRYSFGGLPEGRFKVKVLPYGTDYAEQTQEVVLSAVSVVPGSGADHQQVDFYLKPRPGAGPSAAPGAVFAQEVPDEARKLYEKGVNDLREKREREGFESLKKALEISPGYYLALDRLGTEYAARGERDRSYFEAARLLLKRAVEVNPASYSSTFGLGYVQYHLGQTSEAVESLQRAVSLYGRSANGQLWLGIALKRAGKHERAEAAFKHANDLSGGKEAEVHWQLAGLYGEQNRYKEAADELELFLKNKPGARDAEKIRQLIKQLREKTAAR